MFCKCDDFENFHTTQKHKFHVCGVQSLVTLNTLFRPLCIGVTLKLAVWDRTSSTTNEIVQSFYLKNYVTYLQITKVNQNLKKTKTK